MRIRQQIEICTGIATPISMLIYIYYGIIKRGFFTNIFNGEIDGDGILLVFTFVIVLLISCMVAVGAYFDVKGSDMGKDIIYLCGAILIFIYGLWGFIVLIYSGVWYGLLVYNPVFFSALTIIFAMSSKKNTSLRIY
jgi:cation transport ATPase